VGPLRQDFSVYACRLVVFIKEKGGIPLAPPFFIPWAGWKWIFDA
jgi:hypothetical protein